MRARRAGYGAPDVRVNCTCTRSAVLSLVGPAEGPCLSGGSPRRRYVPGRCRAPQKKPGRRPFCCAPIGGELRVMVSRWSISCASRGPPAERSGRCMRPMPRPVSGGTIRLSVLRGHDDAFCGAAGTRKANAPLRRPAWRSWLDARHDANRRRFASRSTTSAAPASRPTSAAHGVHSPTPPRVERAGLVAVNRRMASAWRGIRMGGALRPNRRH